MRKKGFTLIELLAVIIILAIVALIATPIILNVVEESKKSAGQSESNMVLKGITDYCNQEKMGVIKTEYCKDETTLKDNLDKIVNLGKLDKKDVDVIIKDGKIEWLQVKSNGKDYGLQDGGMVLDAKKPLSLIETLLKQYNEGNTVGLVRDGNTSRYYYKGTKEEVANNFLWYGGHQWRVLEFDTDKKTLKLITQQPLTAIFPSSWTSVEQYKTSYINKWLNDYFLKTLKNDFKKNIISSTFNLRITNNISDLEILSNVGLLDEFEYIQSKSESSFLDIKQAWWLGNTNDLGARNIDVDGSIKTSDSNVVAYGVRPVINILDININSGTGEISDNYKSKIELNKSSGVQVGDYINVPYNGDDCGQDKKCTFRVVSIENNDIKVILNGILPNKSIYGKHITISSDYTIYEYLNHFYNKIEDNLKNNTLHEFNISSYRENTNFEMKENKEVIKEKIGLPVIGEIFSGNDIELRSENLNVFTDPNIIENQHSSDKYWTMNRYGYMYHSPFVNAISDKSHVTTNYPNEYNGVRPVIFLRNDLKLVSGDGSPSAPYELQ